MPTKLLATLLVFIAMFAVVDLARGAGTQINAWLDQQAETLAAQAQRATADKAQANRQVSEIKVEQGQKPTSDKAPALARATW